MINRRKFIHNSSLGFLSFLIIPIESFSIPLNLPNTNPNIELAERLFTAAQKRKEGRINRAITLFNKIIEDFPTDIRAYDGLRKTLLQRKYNELNILELYENGLAANPNNKDFKERLAKEYIRIILGNKKFTNEIEDQENLLIKARRFFRDLNEEYPERVEYQEQLRKVRRKIRQQADTLDARNNSEIKEYKKTQINRFRRRFNDKTIPEVEEKLNQLLNKPQNDLRNKHIKELYKILIKKSKQNNDFEGAFLYARDFYNFDKNESRAFFLAKKFARKSENYDELISLSEENHVTKQNFWSNLNRFDAHYLRYRKTQIGNLTSINLMLDEIENMIQSPQHTQEFIMRKIKIGFKTNQLEQSKNHLLEFGNSILGTTNKHNILLFIILSSRYYKKIGNENLAIQILNNALGLNVDFAANDSLGTLILSVLSDIDFENEQHIERLNSIRERIISNQTED
ncbi:MAG: tetratricopeptide repeat protein [Weeksellaceae bacterium]